MTFLLIRSNTPAKRSPEPIGQLMGKLASPNSDSSWSMISRGSNEGRSSLLTNVKIGSFLGMRGMKQFHSALQRCTKGSIFGTVRQNAQPVKVRD
jgi:hypothetical protein